MALQGPIPVEFGHVFPRGAFAAGSFEPVRDFEASKGGRFVQSKDKHSDLPLWVVEVIDADTSARDKTARVKVASADLPALPPAPSGLPFVPVEFTGLTVTPYVTRPGGWPTRSRRLACERQAVAGEAAGRTTARPKEPRTRSAA